MSDPALSIRRSSFELHCYTCDSTMNVARLQATKENSFVITSDRQTHGKGTKGRSWIGTMGNMHATLGIDRDLVSESQIQCLSLLVGRSVIHTMREWIPHKYQSNFHIKWPNDILADNEKVAGILIESTVTHFLVGIGINVMKAPELSQEHRQATALEHYGFTPDRNRNTPHKMACHLLKNFSKELKKPFFRETFLEQWKQEVRWDVPLKMRALNNRLCWPVDINLEGQLQVRDEKGEYHWLTSEYLT